MLFPIIFIFLGLFLATIKPIREGVPKVLNPSLFPEPSHLIFNEEIPHPNLVNTKTQMIDGIFTDYWDMNLGIPITGSDLSNFTDLVSKYDDYLFS